MPTRELLPGVTTDSCPPSVVCDAHAAIKKARRRLLLRDGVQLALIGAVDYLFVQWSDSRLPFLERADSMVLLSGVNALIVLDLWATRMLPKWAARRVAATWSRAEQERFR